MRTFCYLSYFVDFGSEQWLSAGEAMLYENSPKRSTAWGFKSSINEHQSSVQSLYVFPEGESISQGLVQNYWPFRASSREGKIESVAMSIQWNAGEIMLTNHQE